jgi:hypothetical protein
VASQCCVHLNAPNGLDFGMIKCPHCPYTASHANRTAHHPTSGPAPRYARNEAHPNPTFATHAHSFELFQISTLLGGSICPPMSSSIPRVKYWETIVTIGVCYISLP